MLIKAINNLFRKYTKLSVFGRLIAISACIIAIIILLVNSGKNPEDIRDLVAANANQALAVRDWMQDKNLDTIKLVNKENRNLENGVSIQTGKLYCYFEGPGTDILLNATSIDHVSEVMDKAFDLKEFADQSGAYAYIRHPNVFEVRFSTDPYHRVTGIEGTPAYYSDLPLEKINAEEEIGVKNVVPWENGWFIADADKQSFSYISVRSDSIWFFFIEVLLTFMIIRLVVSLLYKRRECGAAVVAKRSEYRGNRPRIVNLIDDAVSTWLEKFMVYRVTFHTEKDETFEMRVPKLEYERLKEKAHGHLKYKSLGGRCKYIDFQISGE